MIALVLCTGLCSNIRKEKVTEGVMPLHIGGMMKNSGEQNKKSCTKSEISSFREFFIPKGYRSNFYRV